MTIIDIFIVVMMYLNIFLLFSFSSFLYPFFVLVYLSLLSQILFTNPLFFVYLFLPFGTKCQSLCCVQLFETPCKPIRLLCPQNSPGKYTGVVCHFLLQGIFMTQGIEPGSPALQADSLPSKPPGILFLLFQLLALRFYLFFCS